MAAVVVTAGTAMASSVGVSSTPPQSEQTTSFGGPDPVRVTRVGRIEVDLEAAGAATLRRIRCAGVPASTACFVSR